MGTERKPRGYWTLERCMEDAARFSHVGEWRRESSSAHSIASRNGWLGECCGHMARDSHPRGYWTLERCMEDAAKYSAKAEWVKTSQSPYTAARRNGWLEQCCAHMVAPSKPSGYWTLERCMEDASKHQSRIEWERASRSAYTKAHRKGWLDHCCAHMERAGGTDNDVVYIWRNAGTDLHKIGITSDKSGDDRIGKCGSKADMDPRIVFMLKVDDARAVEAELLKLGKDPELDSSIDGYTEFRILTNEELGKAVSTAYQYAVAA